MTRVRMLVYTSWRGQSLRPGDELEVPVDVGSRWERRGIAVVIADNPPKSLEDYTIPELRALAEERGINLGDATRKADILSVIEAAIEAVIEGDAD